MQVTKVQIYLVEIAGRHPVLVQVFTDEGLSGVGEAAIAYGTGATAAAGMIKDLSEGFLLGRDPFRIEAIWSEMYDHTFWAKGGGPIVFAGISAIEQALWDIKGKTLGVPIYEMLGGKFRDRARVYANGWSFRCATPDDFARQAERVVRDGYTALKLYPLASPEPTSPDGLLKHVSLRSLDRDAEALAVARVKAVRDAVGPDVDVMLDMSAELTTDAIIRLGRRVTEFDIFFFEEPVDPFDVQALKKVSEHLDLPIAVGERIYTRYGFLPILEHRAADIVQRADPTAHLRQPRLHRRRASTGCLHPQLYHPGTLSLSRPRALSDRRPRARVASPKRLSAHPRPARPGRGTDRRARPAFSVGRV